MAIRMPVMNQDRPSHLCVSVFSSPIGAAYSGLERQFQCSWLISSFFLHVQDPYSVSAVVCSEFVLPTTTSLTSLPAPLSVGALSSFLTFYSGQCPYGPVTILSLYPDVLVISLIQFLLWMLSGLSLERGVLYFVLADAVKVFYLYLVSAVVARDDLKKIVSVAARVHRQ